MSNKLFTYSFAKTLYEQKKNYIDTFYPFILKVLPDDETALKIDYIQSKVKENYGLDIPEHSLKSIITRAKKKGYVTEQKWKVKLTEKGVKYLDRLESESEVNRRISELLDDIKIYLKKPQLSQDEIYKIVLSFINQNIYTLVLFFNPASDITKVDLPIKKTRKYEDKLVRYFEITEKQKPTLYKTLQDIVYGSVISTAASSPKIAEIDKKFKSVQVFFDTNFILSIFELHFPEFSKPAKELFNLLKINEFTLKVFDFTVDEIVGVLKNYSSAQHMYIPNVRVDSIYSNLKSKGMTIEDVKEFIQSVEKRIWDLGIKIEPTGIELKTYRPKKEENLIRISRCKPEKSERAQNHDIAAIEKIEQIRGKPAREIERSKAFFLTSDLRLSNCNYFEWGHKENMTVCEVVPDRLITNVLWLKNPITIKDIPLNSIIAIHSREILINRRIWIRFYENAQKLKADGYINDRDLSMIFYNHCIEEVLSKFDESDIDKVTSELILEEIANASKGIDSETQKKLEEQKKIFEDRITQKELEKEKKWERKLGEIKNLMKTRAQKKSKRIIDIVSGICVLIVAILLWKLVGVVIVHWNTIEPIVWIVGFIISIGLPLLGIKIKLEKVRKRLESQLFNRIYRKQLRELKIEDNTHN